MSPEERQLLEKTLELSEENNRILRKMQRAGRLAWAFRVFYWVVIIGISFGTYYFIEPYINQLGQVYGGLQENVDQVKNLSNMLQGQ